MNPSIRVVVWENSQQRYTLQAFSLVQTPHSMAGLLNKRQKVFLRPARWLLAPRFGHTRDRGA